MVDHELPDVLEHVPGDRDQRVGRGVIAGDVGHYLGRRPSGVHSRRSLLEKPAIPIQIIKTDLQQTFQWQLDHLAVLKQTRELVGPNGELRRGLGLQRPQMSQEVTEGLARGSQGLAKPSPPPLVGHLPGGPGEVLLVEADETLVRLVARFQHGPAQPPAQALLQALKKCRHLLQRLSQRLDPLLQRRVVALYIPAELYVPHHVDRAGLVKAQLSKLEQLFP